MTFSKHKRLLYSRMAWSVSRRLNYTIRQTAKTLKGFITSLMITKLAITVIASFKC